MKKETTATKVASKSFQGKATQNKKRETALAVDEPKTIKKRARNGKELTFKPNGQFAKGNAGGGRPKGSKNYGGLTELLKQVLDTHEFKTQDGRSVTGREALVEAVLKRAIMKSDQLTEMIFDRIDGKVTQKVENTNLVKEVRFTIHKRIKH